MFLLTSPLDPKVMAVNTALLPLSPGNLTAGIPGVAIYLDDIVVHRATVERHDEHLHSMFSSMAKHHLTLNDEKCLCRHWVCGVLSLSWWHVPAPLKHKGHPPCPRPSPTQVASFLDMTPYYLHFLPQYRPWPHHCESCWNMAHPGSGKFIF